MGLGESDTRAKLVDPAIHLSGWQEDMIRREERAGALQYVPELTWILFLRIPDEREKLEPVINFARIQRSGLLIEMCHSGRTCRIKRRIGLAHTVKRRALKKHPDKE